MNFAGFSYAKKGLLVRLLYLAVALLFFCFQFTFRRKRGVVVLCYHSVTSEQRKAFESQMRSIASRATTLERVTSSGDGAVAVTFDDAFKCLLDNALPVTQPLGIPVAIFVVTGNIGESPMWLSGSGHPDEKLTTMSAEDLQQLIHEPSCLLGSHSVSHRRLGDLPTKEVETELQSSRVELEGLLGKPCKYLALPHGSYRQEVIDLAVSQGYRGVLTLDEIANPQRWPVGTIGRFSVSPDMWMIEFKLTILGAYSWLHAWRKWVRQQKLTFVR